VIGASSNPPKTKDKIKLETNEFVTIATFTDRDGQEHEIAATVERGGRYVLVDMTPAETLLIERFTDFDDDVAVIDGCARAYLTRVHAYLAGEREAMPTPHPLGLRPTRLSMTRWARPADQAPRESAKPAGRGDAAEQESLLAA
jgi:hypothetical protein